MSAIFDSLGYVRRLEQAGVARSTAEAHADAARDFILAGVATWGAVGVLGNDLRSELLAFEHRMTIKLGGMLFVAVGAIVALERLLA